MISFLNSSQDSFRSQFFILNKINSVRESSDENTENIMLDYLPKIQDILQDMTNLEELKSKGEKQQYIMFKSNLIAKVNQYLKELSQPQNNWISNNTDSSLLEEYKQQLQGILEVLSQSNTHSEISYIYQNQDNRENYQKMVQQDRVDSEIVSEKTLSSKTMSQMISEKPSLPSKEYHKSDYTNRQTGTFVYEHDPYHDNSKTIHKSTLDQKVGFNPEISRNARFTFKNISSDKLDYKMRSGRDMYETIDKIRERERTNGYCKRFNETQVKLVQEKIKRKNDLWKTQNEKQIWKHQLMKGSILFVTK